MLEELETLFAVSVAVKVKVYVPSPNALETVIENDPLEFALALPICWDPLNNLTVLLASALPITVGVLTALPDVIDKLDGADGGVVSCCCPSCSCPPCCPPCSCCWLSKKIHI